MIPNKDYQTESHLLAVQEHKEWLASPHTKLFLARLEDFRSNLLHQAENLVVSNPSDVDSIFRRLIESNNYKRLLTHIRNPDKYAANHE